MESWRTGLMPALLPAAGCVMKRACSVGILHKSAPVKKGSRCLARNCMICNELHKRMGGIGRPPMA